MSPYATNRVLEHRAQKAFVGALFKQDEWTQRHTMVNHLGIGQFPAHRSSPSLVLDVGSGPGDSIEHLLDAGAAKVVCVDLHREMLDAVAADFRTYSKPRILTVQADAAHRLPFASGSFDFALCSGLLHSIDYAEQGFISELSRVVKVGGRVAISNKGLAPWLHGTEWYQLAALALTPESQQWPPIDLLPVDADDVRIQWLRSQAFYVLSFTIGRPPEIHLDARLPGSDKTMADLVASVTLPEAV